MSLRAVSASVTLINGQGGTVTISSTGGTIAITNPSPGDINLEANFTPTTPAGITGDIQINNGGAFAADSQLFWNFSNHWLGVGGTPQTKLFVTGSSTDPASTFVNSGAHSIMFFDTAKAAFRAGQVTGNQFNNANVGTGSIALGKNPRATGTNSVVIGTGSAPGTNATTVGYHSYAYGNESVGIGGGSAYGLSSTAIGSSANSSGQGGTSIGIDSSADGDYSVAIAGGAAIQPYGISIGNGTVIYGKNSAGLGNQVTVSGDTSIGLGNKFNIGQYGVSNGTGTFGVNLYRPPVYGGPTITSDNSFFFFSQKQNTQAMTANNVFVILGASLILDPAVSAANVTTIQCAVDFSRATDAMIVPVGTTAQRPGTPINGMVRYNTSLTPPAVEFYENGAWQSQSTPTPIQTSSNLTVVTNQRYYTTNASTRVVLTLPTTAKLGDQIFVRGTAAGGWQVAQNAGQIIHGATNTTTGTGGSLSSQATYDCVTLECITANTDFIILNQRGTLTTV